MHRYLFLLLCFRLYFLTLLAFKYNTAINHLICTKKDSFIFPQTLIYDNLILFEVLYKNISLMSITK